MRDGLATHRRDGWGFGLAWRAAYRQIVWPHGDARRDWREALLWARPEFEAAYNREPPSVHAARMAVLHDAATTDPPDRNRAKVGRGFAMVA